MHELAVTESVLEIALRHANEQNARRICAVHLVMGQWSSFIDDSIQFYWDIISEGTIAQGAKLLFRRVDVKMECQDCGNEYEPGSREFTCPSCNSQHVKVISGEEFQLEAIDIE